MKPINVLILDDNSVIANKIKERLYDADAIYKQNTNVELVPIYLEVDNVDHKKAATLVNSKVLENNIDYLFIR